MINTIDINKIDIEKYKGLYRKFLDRRETVTLSFMDEKGFPFSSCTPFVELNGKLYVYLSEVAEHFKLMQMNERVDALIIADEVDSNNRFATERVRWSCRPKKIGNDGYEEVFDLFNAKFGEKMMNVLRGMDFSLFELTPESGRYVVGFGLAFDTNIDASQFSHVYAEHKMRKRDGK